MKKHVSSSESSVRALAALLLAFIVCPVPPLGAATRTWDGSYSAYWSAPQNWVENVAPTGGDDLMFPAGAANLSNTNNIGSWSFRSITISGSGYTLRGGSGGATIGLTNGLTATYASGASTVELNLNLGAAQSFECLYSTANIHLSGNINLGAHTLTTVGAGNVRLGGVISGTGGLTKSGPNSGFLTLVSSNSFTGVTTLQGGHLEVQHAHALGATNGGTVLQNGTLRLVGVTVAGESLAASGGKLQAIAATSAWTGPITLSGGITIDLPNAGQTLNLSGSIAGAGGFTKFGPGTVILSGSTQNTYTGDTFVNAGILELSKSGLVEAISAGTLTIGDGVGGAAADVVRETLNHQIGAVSIRINDSGLLDLNGCLDYLLDVTFDGGRVATGSGQWALSGDVTVLANTNRAARVEGRIWLPALRSFTVANSIFYPDLGVFAKVEGGGGIQKSGTGSLLLMNSNSYAGATLVDQGVLAVYNTHALGTTAGGTVVSNGATIVVDNNSHVPLESLTISGSGSGYAALQSSVGTNSWAGEITLAGDTEIRVADAEDSLELSGRVTGTGNVTKSGAGTLIYSGPTANNYAGNTYVNAGTLEMTKTAANAVPLTLHIGVTSGAEHSAVARNLGSAQCDNVVVNATGLYDLNGFNETLGSLALNGGGDVQTGAGLLTLNPSSTLVVAPGSVMDASATISGRLNVGTGQRTLTVGQGLNSGSNLSDLVVDAIISGSAEIIKEGSGELQLNAANTFTGPVTLNEGGLRLANEQGLGSTTAGTSVNGSSYLQLHGGGKAVGLESLTLNSTYQGWGTLYSTSGTNSWAGDITLQSGAWIGVGMTNGLLELSGAISGSGSLTKANIGVVLLSGSASNSYGDTTYVREGVLRLNKTTANGAIPGPLVIGDGTGGAEADVVRVEGRNQIANNAAVTVNSSGLLQMVTDLDAIGSLSGSGVVDLGSGYLQTGFDNTSTTFSGVIRDGAGSEVNKFGTGVFTLTGDNTYRGWTFIWDGTLVVDGNQPSGHISLGSSGTLSGAGTVGHLDSAGNLRPGTSPGILTCSNLNLRGGTDYYVELNGLAPGTGSDQLNVRGTAQLDSPFLHVSLGFMPAVGDSFVILRNDGADAVSGTFASLPEGAALTASNATFRVSYTGGTGNDVVLTVTNVVPVEPLRFTSAQAVGSNIALEWTGGVPFYVVQKKSTLGGTIKWQNATAPMRETQTNLPMDTPTGFYRVKGGN